jgi:hypothetical protein
MIDEQEKETQAMTRYERDVLESARDNHIWVNAFQCIRPTSDFLQQLGANVLRMLDNEGNTILCDHDAAFSKTSGSASLSFA